MWAPSDHEGVIVLKVLQLKFCDRTCSQTRSTCSSETSGDQRARKMFTQETYLQIKLFCKYTSKLANIPMVYNEHKQQFENVSGKAKCWYLFMLAAFTQRVCYHAFTIIYSMFYGFPKVSDATVEIFYYFGFAFSLFVNLGFYYCREDIVVLLNELLVTNKVFQSEFMIEETVQPSGRHWLTGNKYSDGCSLFMKLLTPSSFSTPLSCGVMFLLQPYKRIYFYHLIPGEKPFWLAYLYFIPETYYFCWGNGCIYFFWYILLLYGNSSNFWLEQIG